MESWPESPVIPGLRFFGENPVFGVGRFQQQKMLTVDVTEMGTVPSHRQAKFNSLNLLVKSHSLL